ncbi:hypothetical protein EV424DRAFT_1546453 [Suillus variegatus]|nr:hypothetical protein EV424DRAFT_1546453 [Suillus variegatus]
MHDIVDILQFAEVVPPQCHTGDHTNRVLEDGDHLYDINNEFGMFGELLEEEYDGAGACYSQDSSTFLDLFDADEYAECRVDNLYYPFTSKEEWEVADYLLHLSLSMAAIDEFLKLSMQTKLEMPDYLLHSKAFLLTALLPIPKYLHPNQQMRSMLEDRLVHECLSIVLKPLMKAAEVGIMMADLIGNVHHCFTPLTAYIVDTPEAAMLAFNPDDLEAYFEACADSWLNGVYAPFWIDWPLTDPSIFLMPESLHHWHKEFHDHDLQWCIVVVGAHELDFWFSILQLTTGYHHFSGRISKLKQVTGTQMGTKRPIENWHIPKLELLQSVTSSMRKVGALIQWSADATEHAHISKIKEPAWQTNNNDYNPQICRHLDREEKLRHFTITTSLKSHPTSCDPDFMAEDILEEDDLDDGDKQEINDL